MLKKMLTPDEMKGSNSPSRTRYIMPRLEGVATRSRTGYMT